MKSLQFIAAAALASLAAPSLAAEFPLTRTLGMPKIVPGKVLVELATPAAFSRDADVDVHARFIARLARALPKGSYRARKQYSSAVFTGIAVDLNNMDDLKLVANTTGVQAVRAVAVVKGPKLKFDKKALEEAKGKPQPGMYPPNIMTGVDRVHKMGNKGKGIKIGMIDSGVDYTHPALGGGFGKGFKIAGGYDFVGDNYDPAVGVATPDADPLDTVGHGTHVAGIIGANANNKFNITGVAPEATLNAYRVFGSQMVTDDAILVDALIRAYDDGNDVITLSLSDYSGWSTSTTAVVASRIAKRGRVVVSAAGNEGEFGAWFAEAPASGTDVISVASVDNIAAGPLFTLNTTLAGVAPMPYYHNGETINSIPFEGAGLPLYATSRDSAVEDDACNELPESTPDLSKYITLVRRGTCSFMNKIQNVLAKGGQYIAVYNNDGPFATPDFSGYEYGVLIQAADGLLLLDAYLANTKFTVNFPPLKAITVPNSRTGGLVSTFSSYGPSWDMLMKPQIAAPGGGIIGLFPVAQGSFQVSSGTSMSTPHIAGAAALLLKARGKGVARDVKTLLQTTSTAISETMEENSRRQTLAQAGAGLANVYNAVKYTTTVSPGELLLNDTLHWKQRHSITIRNTGRKARTYKLKHVPAATGQTLVAGTQQLAAGPIPLDDTAVRVRFSQAKVSVRAGGMLSVVVFIDPPRDADKSVIPIVSGHIEVSTQGETLRVSYLGAASDLTKASVVDVSPEVVGQAFPFLIDGTGGVQQGSHNYSFVGEDYPVLSWRQLTGSARMVIDLVKPDLVLPTAGGATILASQDGDAEPLPPVEEPETTKAYALEKRGIRKISLPGIIGWWGHGRPKPGRTGSYARVATLGQLGAFEYIKRHNLVDDPYAQFGVTNAFANGTAIPKGEYKILVRWLKIGGDALRQEHYESWLSPSFRS